MVFMYAGTVTLINMKKRENKGVNKYFSNFFKRLVKSQSNVDKLKDLRGTVKFNNKEALLRELLEKRKETRY